LNGHTLIRIIIHPRHLLWDKNLMWNRTYSQGTFYKRIKSKENYILFSAYNELSRLIQTSKLRWSWIGLDFDFLEISLCFSNLFLKGTPNQTINICKVLESLTPLLTLTFQFEEQIWSKEKENPKSSRFHLLKSIIFRSVIKNDQGESSRP